jgi:antitoxin PrlF
MTKYTGAITTTGTSEAIRLDKALFKAHTEFRQKAKVRASVIAPGQMLISVVEDDHEVAEEADPVLSAFLAFLQNDLATAPQRIAPLSSGAVETASELTTNVKVSDEEDLSDDVTL